MYHVARLTLRFSSSRGYEQTLWCLNHSSIVGNKRFGTYNIRMTLVFVIAKSPKDQGGFELRMYFVPPPKRRWCTEVAGTSPFCPVVMCSCYCSSSARTDCGDLTDRFLVRDVARHS